MSRQGIARSWLGVIVPICFLVLGSVADRILHHAAPPCAQHRTPARPAPRVQAIVVPDAPVAFAPPQTALDVLHKIRRSCQNADRDDGCSPASLGAALADDMPVVRAHYRTLEERYLARLASTEYLPIHALGFLRSRRALPVLREALFMTESPTDWGTREPNEPAIFYADAQFPRHLALMHAIESIEGLPIRDAFKLTRAEHRQLSRRAADCRGDTSAQWLLYKLAGTPLPTFSENRAHRAVCHARVRPM